MRIEKITNHGKMNLAIFGYVNGDLAAVDMATGTVVVQGEYGHWYTLRQATDDEKAEILADLPRFQAAERSRRINKAAYEAVNWDDGTPLSEILRRNNLSAKDGREVSALAAKMIAEGGFDD